MTNRQQRRTDRDRFPVDLRGIFSAPSLLWSAILLSSYTVAAIILVHLAQAFETADGVFLWYPPAGLSVTLLLGFGLRFSPFLIVPSLYYWWILKPGQLPLHGSVLAALCILVGYSAASLGFLRHLRRDPHRDRLRDLFYFVAIMGLTAPFLVALSYVALLVQLAVIPESRWWVKVLHFWAGDATGIAMLAPLLLMLLRSLPWQSRKVNIASFEQWKPAIAFPPSLTPWQWLEAGLEMLALVGISWFAYTIPLPEHQLDYTYFVFLPIIWIAVRHGWVRTTFAVLLVNLSVAIFVHDNFVKEYPLALQFGLMAISYTGLLLGGFVTQRKGLLDKLLYDAYHDSLTGLPNRRWFRERVQQSIQRAKREPDYSFAVLFLDLNRFKTINDSFGHSIGDRLLCQVAKRLETTLRDRSEIVLNTAPSAIAYFGCDVFILLLEETEDTTVTLTTVEGILSAFSLPFYLDEHEIFTSASIGIVQYCQDYYKPEQFFRDADIALYHAKSKGTGNNYAIFDTAMHEDVLRLTQLETDLRRSISALESGQPPEFIMHYQPIISLETGRLIGFEALIRWQHPQRGFVSPVQFIPLAEDTGLIIPLGRWGLREACRQIQQWQQEFTPYPPLIISVNLSIKQLIQLNLVEQITQILEETQLPPHCLKLELTESVVMENAEDALRTFEQLRALGIRIAIDDFGTGYSSLSYLYRFPVSTLKIDRSFVEQMGIEAENTSIVEAIITLAHSLEMKVTAEGVETEAQLNRLRELGCDEGQGYFLSRPLASQAVIHLLQQF